MPDAFIKAAEAARHRLIIAEGAHNISWRTLFVDRANAPSKRAGWSHHLNPKNEWPKGHHVPLDLIDVLVKHLPISREELELAAAHAAGYTTVGGNHALDLHATLAGHFPDDLPDDQFRDRYAELTQKYAELTAEHIRRLTARGKED